MSALLVLILAFQEAPLIRLEAESLPDGPLGEWANAGSLGGSLKAAAGTEPRVGTVEGKRAVTFSGRQWLRSTVEARDLREFTVVVVAFNPEPAANETLVACGTRPRGFAELRWDEFAGEGAPRAHVRKGAPPGGRWQHLACSYGGGALAITLNGEPVSSKPCALQPAAGPILLGAAWDGKKETPFALLTGSIAQVRIYGRAWSEREIRNDLGLTSAFGPSPAPGSILEELEVTLRWKPGSANARSYRVTFDGVPRSLPETTLGPIAVLPGREYRWRVDTLDEAGENRWPGEEWTFRTSAGPACDPSPSHRFGGVPRETRELRWKPGKYAVSQEVWFGADPAKLEPVVRGLDAAADRCALPALEPGRFYHWRVDTNNGTKPPAPGEPWTFRVEDARVLNDITFFVASDPHFGLSPETDAVNRETIDDMHALPGSRFPEKMGGEIVPTPRGVLITGDLTENGNSKEGAAQWSAFEAHYGLDGKGYLKYPVFEGFGNHDGNSDRPPRLGVKARNARRAGLRKVSENGLHYSWDWDNVHFVNLNLYAGSKASPEQAKRGTWQEPERSLEFLAADLAENAGRPVILYHHYGFDGYSNGWYAEEERKAYAEALKGHPVLAVFYGHTHGVGAMKWNGIDAFNAPAAQPTPGRYLAVRIRPDRMIVAERRGGGWGMSWSVPLNETLLKPAKKE